MYLFSKMCKKIQTIDTLTKQASRYRDSSRGHPVVVDEIMHTNTCSLSCRASFCAVRWYDGTEPYFFWSQRSAKLFSQFDMMDDGCGSDPFLRRGWNLTETWFGFSSLILIFLGPTFVVCACFVCKAVAFVILGEAYVGALLRRLPSCGFSRYI